MVILHAMKLDNYFMSEAIDNERWDDAIQLLCQHFGIARPCSEYEIRKNETFIRGIAIITAVPSYTYSWTIASGFCRAETMLATTSRILIWHKP